MDISTKLSNNLSKSKNFSLILHQVGVKKMVVFINKADLVDEEMLELVELEAQELLEQFGYDAEDTPIVKVRYQYHVTAKGY